MPRTNTGLVRRAIANLVVRALQLQNLQSISSNSSWWWPFGIVHESFAGAWQQNVTLAPTQTLLSYPPVWACVTGIATDISKMRIKLSRNEGGIWKEVDESPWLKVLREPNRYQNQIQFIESWMLSRLMYGNTYVLKERQDKRGIVTRMHVLHPGSVTPLVSEDSQVYYEIDKDVLTNIDERVVIPESEIIHDRFNTLWHPLIGISPLYACAMAGTLGNTIQAAAVKFFANKSMPGGMLTAPGRIAQETADRMKASFETNFGGENVGRLFVAGDGLTFEPFSFDAQKSQQKEQSEQATLDVGRAFRYPAWKLGGPQPPYSKPDQAQTSYYVDCLQGHIQGVELALSHGLELPMGMGVEFDLDELMRMDTEALFESNNKAKGWMMPDEQRFRANLEPLPVGGNTVYLQHQDYPIAAIANRTDVQPQNTPTPPVTPAPTPEPDRGPTQFETRNNIVSLFRKRKDAA